MGMGPSSGECDVIVIGTGMGGATIGYGVARAKGRVLFLEKGRSHLGRLESRRGNFAEADFPRPDVPRLEYREVLLDAGRSVDTLEDRSGPRHRAHLPFIGTGTGGSSALYGMALERLFPSDFSPRSAFPDVNGSSLPERWPIAFELLAPFYEKAERLFRVRGAPDPLADRSSQSLLPPPPLHAANQELFDHFRNRNLHPYQLPMACESVEGCRGCQGYLCARECKNDSARVCLEPAIKEHGAELLDECEVLSLEASAKRVTGVRCRRHGEEFTLRAETIVLAAGALWSPIILLRSSSTDWPGGLANASGFVGRHLMRHYVDLYAVQPKTRPSLDGNVKAIAFNDFYHVDGLKLGTVQSFGRLPAAPVLAEALHEELREGTVPGLGPLFGLAKPFVRAILDRKFSRSLILASLVEDLPCRENHVRPSEDGSTDRLLLEYRIRPAEAHRIAEMRRRMKDALSPYSYMLLKQAENNDRIAHACGTCRFGNDPDTSVLDPNCKAWGLENLYVVDASFFPSSGGTNPALTIAANALRVAEHIVGRPISLDS